ncbi:SIMPL domain-containing protein [Streptomyces sp. NPDC005573]|uniref:SIMPL domain-containing protein n=1 Tax=unclassified Streptomyces TaxID=2593676 RepID=UPI0033A046B7
MTTTPPPAHGTPEAPLLTTRGHAEFDVEPELASIGVTVTARGRDRRTTLDDLTRRNTDALDLIKSYGQAVTRVSTGTLTLTPELSEHGRGERVRAYLGHVHLSAELTDFTALGELTTRLADLELTRVEGPWWSLRLASPVHTKARQRAVADALQRAREYAESLGTTIAALIELADTGSEAGAPGRAPYGRSARTAFPGGPAAPAGPAAPLDLEPPRLRVSAQVSAQFTMRPPRL